MSNTTWKEFEQLTQKIHSELSPDLFVKIDHRQKGISGASNQCDVVIKQDLKSDQILSIIECKDYNKKIGISFIREFKSKIEDIKANKGIYVTTIGYTSEAIKFASYHHIEVLTLFDASSRKWGDQAFIPILINFNLIESYKIALHDTETRKSLVTYDRENKNIYDKNYIKGKKRISFAEIISGFWTFHTFRENEQIIANSTDADLYIPDLDIQIYCSFNIKVKTVKRQLNLTIEEGRGLKSDSSILSNYFISEPLSTCGENLYTRSTTWKKGSPYIHSINITERIVKDPNYILPRNIIFNKSDSKESIEKIW